MTLRFATVSVTAMLLAGCMGREAPVASPAPIQAAPVQRVETAALPAPAVQTTAAAPVPVSGRAVATTPSRIELDGMRTAPGARESTTLSNVSRVSTGAPTGGNALGGTIVSGQTAGASPTPIDRNREPSRRISAPRDPLGPATPPPVIAPELRDTTGRSIRNRQEVQF